MIVDVIGQALQPFILLYGLANRSGSKPSNAPDVRLLNLARVFSMSAMLSVMGVLAADRPSTYSILGGIHLVAQGSMYNFLAPYAMLCFPVAIRARCMGFIGLAGCIGNTAGPLFGSFCLGQLASKKFGATVTIWITGIIYAIGFGSMLGITASDKHMPTGEDDFAGESLELDPHQGARLKPKGCSF